MLIEAVKLISGNATGERFTSLARADPRRPADVRDHKPRAQAHRPHPLRHARLRRGRGLRCGPRRHPGRRRGRRPDRHRGRAGGDDYRRRRLLRLRDRSRAARVFTGSSRPTTRSARAGSLGHSATPTATSASPGSPSPAGPRPIASADPRPAPWDGTSRSPRLLPMQARAPCAGTGARAVSPSSAAGHFARVAELASRRASFGAASRSSERPPSAAVFAAALHSLGPSAPKFRPPPPSGGTWAGEADIGPLDLVPDSPSPFAPSSTLQPAEPERKSPSQP